MSAVDATNGINYATGATYAPQGALAGAKYGVTGTFAGITVSNNYNKRLQPSLLSASAPAATVLSLFYDFRLGVADNGNVAAITNNRDGTRSVSYSYDGLNRIATARTTQSALWGQSFGYDAWGNLLTQTVTQGTALPLSVSANGQNQIVGFCYDAAGNLLDQAACGSVHAYVYDAENRLVATAGMGYTYDGDGKRVRKCPLDGNGTCVAPGKLYWTGMGSDPLDESDASGNINEEYVFFNGKRIARADVGAGNTITAVHYYFADHLGSASVVTSDHGVIEQESDYFPFGGERVITAGPNNYKFTGKERDSESGLDEFGARYYSSALGRFTIPDWAAKPIAVPYADLVDPETLNLYSYVRDLPTSKIDLDGHAVKVGDDLALERIKSTLPKSLQDKVRLDKNGLIDKNILTIKSKDSNFRALQDAVRNKNTVEVTTASGFADKNGKGYQFEYKTVDQVNAEIVANGGTAMDPKSLIPTSYLGQTIPPGESTTGNIQVVLADGKGATASAPAGEFAATTAHELYGHALPEMQGKPYEHDHGGPVDRNIINIEEHTRGLQNPK